LGCLATGSVVLFTRNPVQERFREIVTGDLALLKREKFDPGIYFNGLQFRLLQWRFVPEILNENRAWLAGVTYGGKQTLLDKKYISTDMYIGWAPRKDKGFLGYNAHSQLLESLLQGGIIGLISYLFICFAMARMAWLRKQREFSFIAVMMLIFSLTESAFESQYSILISLFFPLFFYKKKNLVVV
jgi:O-antigen ligase